MKASGVIAFVTVYLGIAPLPGLCADLSGRIIVTKKLGKKKVILPAYSLRGAAPALDESHLGSDADNVAVFLEGQLPGPDRPLRAELEQHGQRFEPQLLVVPVGSTVSFPNADPIFHNVFSLSGAKKFDLGYYPAGQTRTVKFDEPGVVQVYCHLHPNMYAAIVVTPNRWHTKPSDDGTFSFHDVPPGTYTLVAWHMNAGFFRTEVRVTGAGSGEVVVMIPYREGDRHH